VITPWQISFTDSILYNYRDYCHNRNYLYYLSQTIPFYLVDKYTFSLIRKGNYHIFNKLDDEYNQLIFENEQENVEHNSSKYPETELLGCYVSKGSHGIPEIYLCTDTIMQFSTNDEELTYLLAKVIIHELAHAYMDKHDYCEKDEFYEWMEESCANEITLEYFQQYEDSFRLFYDNNCFTHITHTAYKFVKNFILSQPDNYKLGYYLHENWIRKYSSWQINKYEVSQKTKAKLDWLNYVKSNIKAGSINKDRLDKLTYDVLFEDPYNELSKDEK